MPLGVMKVTDKATKEKVAWKHTKVCGEYQFV